MTTKPTTTKLTQKDRDALLKLANERREVAKTTARRRTADVMAQFEVELQTFHERKDNETFARVTEILGIAVSRAREEVDKECERLGIPSRFRPRINVGWNPGGMMAADRKLMLEIAKKQAAAQQMRAYEQIEQAVVMAKTKIVAASFDAGVAMNVLNSLPSIEQLIPPMSFASIEQMFLRDPQRMLDEYNRSQDYHNRIRAENVYALAKPAATKDEDGEPLPVPRIGSSSPWADEDE